MIDPFDCFKREEDGSWTSLRSIAMDVGQDICLAITAGRNFKSGDLLFGIDLAAELDARAALDATDSS
jgi:hypothetical protein